MLEAMTTGSEGDSAETEAASEGGHGCAARDSLWNVRTHVDWGAHANAAALVPALERKKNAMSIPGWSQRDRREFAQFIEWVGGNILLRNARRGAGCEAAGRDVVYTRWNWRREPLLQMEHLGLGARSPVMAAEHGERVRFMWQRVRPSVDGQGWVWDFFYCAVLVGGWCPRAGHDLMTHITTAGFSAPTGA